MSTLTPKRIVAELDKYIIGQSDAKRATAIALRNRWRRQRVRGELQEEIIPNNIIMIGPTGVGKTEIARRLSRLANAPFIKVEASKFTEVGYVGRDVESMIRELMDIAVNDVRAEMTKKVDRKARVSAREKVLDHLLPPPKLQDGEEEEGIERYNRSRQKMAKMLDNGKLDDHEIEITQEPNNPPHIEIFSNIGLESFDLNFSEMLSNMMPFQRGDSKRRKMKVPQALEYMTQMEAGRMVNKDKVIETARERVEDHGIIFIDEIDKIASREKEGRADVSRTGVQRDLLPIVEGSNVPTKYGIINTRHILFIAAGAFHSSKPSDLIPELQGRFPIRVELSSLSVDDFEKILKFPKNALLKQYTAMFKTEKVALDFTDEAVREIARYAAEANQKMEDIGARRLHTILNTLLDDYLFDMPKATIKKVMIDKEEVAAKLDRIISDEDLSRYIL